MLKVELTKWEIFCLLKRAEDPKTPKGERQEIANILSKVGLTATYFSTVTEFKLNGVLFAKKITCYSTKKHHLGYKETRKYILL